MATEISLIASLLHLRCIDNGIEARQAVESGSYLVREDDVKAVVVKLRAAHDKSRDEMEAMRERAEKAEAQLASITGVTRLELVAAERAKRDGLLAACKALVESVQWLDVEFNDSDEEKEAEAVLKAAVDAIAAAEAAP